MDVFASGAWRTPGRAEVYIGGAWRRVTRAEVYIGGVWRTAVRFTSPMIITVTPTVSGYRYAAKPTTATVTSDYAQVTPTGGVAPYSYVWTESSGMSISNPAQAFTTFSATVAGNSERNGSASVTCTDAVGNTASGNTEISLINDSGGL